MRLFINLSGVMLMRKRNCRVVVYFTKDELDALTKKVRRTQLSREGFLRKLASEAEIKEAPHADVPQLLNQLRRVGYNLDQILKRANSTGVLDVPQLRKDIADIRAAVKAVQDAYTMKNS